jgi:hypothetical protein
MAAKKFQNLTIDAKTLRRFSVSDRLDFLRSSEGLNILPNFTPSELNELFPRYYTRVNKEFQAAMKAVSDRRNVNGGVSSSSASPVQTSTPGTPPASSSDDTGTAAPVGRQRSTTGSGAGSGGNGTGSARTATQAPVTETWRARIRSRYGVDIDAVSGLNNSPLGNLIGDAESGRAGYNAYNRETRGNRIIGPNGPVDLENMTIGELTRRQNLPLGHPDKILAAGRYQITPEPMREAIQNLGLSPDQRFDRTTQDRILRDYLLSKKRPAIESYITGRSNDARAAINSASAEWAALRPHRGASIHEGRNGNRATVTPDRTLAALNHAKETYRKAIESGKTPAEAWRTAFGVMETQSSGPIPQLPTGLDPKLVEEYNQMSPQQQRNFHTALGKLDTDPARAAEAMNGIYREAPAAAQRAGASGVAGTPATPSNPDAVPGLPTPPGAPSGATRQGTSTNTNNSNESDLRSIYRGVGINLTGGAAERGYSSSLDRMNPEMLGRYHRAMQQLPPELRSKIQITSANRDPDDPRIQALYARWLAGDRRIPMADPRRSNHGRGGALDVQLGHLSNEERRLVAQTMRSNGLIAPVRREGFHNRHTHLEIDRNYRGEPAGPAFQQRIQEEKDRLAAQREQRVGTTNVPASNTAAGTNVQTTAPAPTANATPSSPSSMPTLRTEEKPVTQTQAPAQAQAQAPAQAQTPAQPAPEAPATPTTNVKASEKEKANTDIPVLATGGQIRTNSDELRAYPIDKHKSQRENMLVTDGTNKPLFAMNSEEELRYNPDSGKATVNPSPRGLKTDPSTLQQRLESPVEQTPPTQTPNSEQGVRPTPTQNQSPTININSPVMPAPNSFDSIRDGSLTRMSPSFERAVARSRFQNTGDQTLGGHFDWGAANIV